MICKFAYVPEVEDNVRQHDIYHEHFLNGIQINNIEEYQNIKISNKFSILIINQLIPFEKRKIAQNLAIFPLYETRFSGLPYSAYESLDERNVHALLLIKDDRAMGLLVMELRSEIWLTNWIDYYNNRVTKLTNHEPIWSISMVWIANAHRRKGYCKIFIDKTLSFFKTDTKKIGWYTPFTENGESFVRSICPNDFYIAK